MNSIESALVLIMLIASGWIMSKAGWINEDVKEFLSKVAIQIGVPALVVSKFFGSLSKEMLISLSKFIAISVLSMIIMIVLSTFIWKILKIGTRKRGSFVSMSTVSNSMFFGLPICLSLFGEESIGYILSYYIANTVVFWAILSPMIAKDGTNEINNSFENLKKIFNIPLITVIISGILVFLNLKPPTVILRTAAYFSNLVTPLACMVVGKIIYDIDFARYKIDKSIVVVIIMRFIIAPTVMYIVARYFQLPALVSQVLILQAAMPVMMQTSVVSEIYKADSQYVATSLSLTTIFSLITIPIYIAIMGKMFV
jgi:hypothetical protein